MAEEEQKRTQIHFFFMIVAFKTIAYLKYKERNNILCNDGDSQGTPFEAGCQGFQQPESDGDNRYWSRGEERSDPTQFSLFLYGSTG
jgi:hypothetical protein